MNQFVELNASQDNKAIKENKVKNLYKKALLYADEQVLKTEKAIKI